MGELLDRDFQRKLLGELQELYPQSADIKRSWGEQTDNRLLVNLSYLDEHGLVSLNSRLLMSGEIQMLTAKITAKGMDFIANDGGLSAILGVVTIKLHEDSIKELLISHVKNSTAEPSVKSGLVDKIRALPADALGKLAEKALDAGLGSLPNLTGWLLSAI